MKPLEALRWQGNTIANQSKSSETAGLRALLQWKRLAFNAWRVRGGTGQLTLARGSKASPLEASLKEQKCNAVFLPFLFAEKPHHHWPRASKEKVTLKGNRTACSCLCLERRKEKLSRWMLRVHMWIIACIDRRCARFIDLALVLGFGEPEKSLLSQNGSCTINSKGIFFLFSGSLLSFYAFH